MQPYRNGAYIAFGWLCVALGAVGAVLPLLPTTVFLLIAAWAFAKGSPRLHGWLMGHPALGPYIRDWQDYGRIPRRAKALAIVMIGISAAWLTFGMELELWVLAAALTTLACVVVFILTRPSDAIPRSKRSKETAGL